MAIVGRGRRRAPGLRDRSSGPRSRRRLRSSVVVGRGLAFGAGEDALVLGQVLGVGGELFGELDQGVGVAVVDLVGRLAEPPDDELG